MDLLEPAQGMQWRSFHIREAEIKLRHFVACNFAGVGHRRFGDNRAPEVAGTRTPKAVHYYEL